MGGEADQVIAVGAEAVAQNYKLGDFTAVCRAELGTVQTGKVAHCT